MPRNGRTIISGILFCAASVFVSVACAPKTNPERWIFLGMSQFDERQDTANIRVGPSEGVFSRLRFEVSDTGELNWVIVFFENGDRWSPDEGFKADYKKVRPGMAHRNQEFDLPSDEGAIKRIEVRIILADFTTSKGSVKVYGLKKADPSESSVNSAK
jgi:hypothetical protein